MKRKLLFLLCALLTSVGMWADVVPTASTPSVGQSYYLYNPKTQKFLCKTDGKDGNTERNLPYVLEYGHAWTLENSDVTGYVKLHRNGGETEYFWGKYWAFIGADYSTYPNEVKFNLEKIDDTDYDYHIHSYEWGANAAYVYINTENANRVAINSHAQVGLDQDYTVWQFISETDYATYLTNRYGTDVTNLVTNPTFNSNKNGWTAYPGFTNNQIASNQYVAFTVPFWENWRSNDEDGGVENKMYQNISNISNGVYTLVMAAFVNYLDAEHQYVFANNNKTYLTTTTPTYYEVQTLVKDKSISIGLEQTSTKAGWMGIDNVHLYYLGNDVSYYSPATFTSGSSATADTWYVFTVPSSGWYTITPSAAGTFGYTQDESDDADKVSRFYATTTGKYQYLTEGKFYFKTNTAATVNIAATSISANDDVTGYINDPSFEHVALSSSGTTTSEDFLDWEVTSDALQAFISHKDAGSRNFTHVDGNNLYNTWRNSSNYYLKQTLHNLPVGKYTLSCYVATANDNTINVALGTSSTTATGSGAGTGVLATVDYVNTSVANRLIAVTSSDWFKADDFKLKFLGTCLVNDAVSFTSGNTTTADSWYYYDIPATGNYGFTSSAEAELIYTTDGTLITSEATGTDESFSEGQIKRLSLSEGRLYFKTNEATTLTILKYNYSVGSATKDISYIQPDNTVTITWGDAETNDPDASFGKNGTPNITFNSETIDITPTADGFTFTVPDGLTAGTEYTLAIPANAFGYADGSTYNAAQNITLTTPAIFDGVYYMYNTDTENYISRSGNWATQAIMDNNGLAFRISTDANNNTKLQYFDNLLWLGQDGFCYGDCDGDGVRSFNVTKVTGGYKFLNTNNSKYLAVYNNQAVADAVEGGNLQGTSNIWSLESTESHIDNYTRNANAQASAVATEAGINAATKAALETALESYAALPIAITGAKEEKYEQYASRNETLIENTYRSETVDGLKPGLYKLSVDAFQRAAWYDWVSYADGARGTIYLYAKSGSTTRKTQLKSVMEYGADDAYTGEGDPDYEDNSKHYPNNVDAAYTALATGNYKNDVYVYVTDAGSGTGSLEIGIKNPTRQGNKGVSDQKTTGTWAVYDNWTLTYYGNDDEDFVEFHKLIIEENKGDITSLINSDFEEDADGWSGGTRVTGLARSWRNGSVNNPFYEVNADHGIVDGKGKMTYTVSNMPAGTYKVVAAARAYDGGVIQPEIAGTTGASLTGVGDNRNAKSTTEINMNGVQMPYSDLGGFTNNPNGHNWQWITATGTLESDGDLVINFNCTGTSWMPIDDVHLYCTELDETNYTRTVGDGKGTINTSNSVVTVDIILDNPNTILRTTGKITTAAGQDMNNDQYNSERITKLVLYDGYDFTNSNDDYGLDDGATLYRNIPADTWCTLMVPFYPTNLDVMKVPASLSGEGTLSFEDAPGKDMNDSPMLVKSTDGVTAITGLRNSEKGTGKGTGSYGEGATMVGTYIALDAENPVPTGSYVVARKNDADALYKVKGTVTLNTFRAYFTVPSGELARITLDFDNEDPTAINVIEAAAEEAEGLKDGKYLENGQIIIVKNGVKYSANGQKLN